MWLIVFIFFVLEVISNIYSRIQTIQTKEMSKSIDGDDLQFMSYASLMINILDNETGEFF